MHSDVVLKHRRPLAPNTKLASCVSHAPRETVSSFDPSVEGVAHVEVGTWTTGAASTSVWFAVLKCWAAGGTGRNGAGVGYVRTD